MKEHDGFKSRKFLSTAIGTGAIEAIATVAFLGLDKMDAGQWIGFNQWLWPIALGIFCVTNVSEKVLAKPPVPSK